MRLIAETAWHHEGDFEFQKQLIEDIVAKSNVDIVKMHISLDPHEYLAPDFPSYKGAPNNTFSEEQWLSLVEIVRKGGKEVMLLLNDSKSVDLSKKIKPELVEIHSVAINDLNLLGEFQKNVSQETKIVLGVGGSTIYEIETAIQHLPNRNIVLMFGFQNYPTKYSDINFEKIRRIMGLYKGMEFGYADHTSWEEKNNTLITLMGASIGMHYIEKHVTNQYGQKRCDFEAAISIDMVNELHQGLKLLEQCNGNGQLNLNKGEKKYARTGFMKRAAFIKEDVSKGQVLSKDNIEFLRTNSYTNLTQHDIIDLVGEVVVEDIAKGTILKKEHFKQN